MFGLMMLGALALGAQTPPAAVPPTVFDSAIDVRVVNVEAVVTDGKGKLVRGLSAADFRLLVDGREVPVEYFTEVADGKAAATAPAPQAPVAAGEEVGRSYLVFVDDAFSLANVRDQALANLERDLTLLQPADRMAVLAFDGTRIDVLSDWTGDAAALADALERARKRAAAGGEMLAHQRKLQKDVDVVLENQIDDGDTNPLTNTIGREMEALGAADQPGGADRARPDVRVGRRARCAAFPSPPGRKVMLLLSAAWTMSVAPRVYAPLVEAANRLGYTIYPVDMGQSNAHEITALGRPGRRHRAAGWWSRRSSIPSARWWRTAAPTTGSASPPPGRRTTAGTGWPSMARRAGLKVRSRGGFSDLSKRTENAMKAESVLLFGGAEQDRRLIVRLGAPKPAGRGRAGDPGDARGAGRVAGADAQGERLSRRDPAGGGGDGRQGGARGPAGIAAAGGAEGGAGRRHLRPLRDRDPRPRPRAAAGVQRPRPGRRRVALGRGGVRPAVRAVDRERP